MVFTTTFLSLKLRSHLLYKILVLLNVLSENFTIDSVTVDCVLMDNEICL